MKRTLTAVLGLVLTVVTVTAQNETTVDVGEKAKGAKKVVVATVADVESEFGENDYGDRLILSRVSMRVDETMKGPHEATVVMTIEGGTVGDLTLEVSDMPEMKRGERAVLFLEDAKQGGYNPHRRGAGVMKLSDDDRAVGTDMTLEDIRAAVKGAQSQGNK